MLQSSFCPSLKLYKLIGYSRLKILLSIVDTYHDIKKMIQPRLSTVLLELSFIDSSTLRIFLYFLVCATEYIVHLYIRYYYLSKELFIQEVIYHLY
jgi:hypothetical protein